LRRAPKVQTVEVVGTSLDSGEELDALAMLDPERQAIVRPQARGLHQTVIELVGI
jgi:hypothetical protein